MPLITKSIGTTARDYSTITLWEADLDNGAVYAAGDQALGECYNDSNFNETAITINGGGTIGLTKVTLSVASGQRHTGIAGTGARIVRSAGGTNVFALVPLAGTQVLILEWLEIDINGQTYSASAINSSTATTGRVPVIQRMIVHDLVTTTAGAAIVMGSARDILIQDSIVYDMSASGGASRMAEGIAYRGDQANGGCFNNTVWKMAASGAAANQDAICIEVNTDNANGKCRNNIGMNTTKGSDASSVAAAFRFAGSTNLTSSNNMSDDATADDGGGSNHLINQSQTGQWVSTVNGSENFHLVATSSARLTGVDLGTTPTGVNLDIDNFDRDSSGVVWDIGADQFTGALGGTLPVMGVG